MVGKAVIVEKNIGHSRIRINFGGGVKAITCSKNLRLVASRGTVYWFSSAITINALNKFPLEICINLLSVLFLTAMLLYQVSSDKINQNALFVTM